jgi:hypothetical protein
LQDFVTRKGGKTVFIRYGNRLVDERGHVHDAAAVHREVARLLAAQQRREDRVLAALAEALALAAQAARAEDDD